MAITFHPAARTVLMCNLESGFRPPEMTKIRPVVVISPKRYNHQTCTVVPLSTVEPKQMQGFHCKLEQMSLPTGLRDRWSWVKANSVLTVALWRLDRVENGRDASGKRIFAAHSVTLADWGAIQRAVRAALAWKPWFDL